MLRKFLLVITLCVSMFMGFGQVFDNALDYPKYAPELLKQDLDFIFKKYGEIHPDFYKETAKDTVKKRLAMLKLSITKPMTRMDFITLFAPVLFHVVTDGHNYVNDPDDEIKTYKKNGGLFFPLPVDIRNRRIYCNSLRGDIPFHSEIVSINQIPAKDIVNRLLSGYNAGNDSFAEALNSPWFSAAYWNRYGSFDKYKIEYIENDSRYSAEGDHVVPWHTEHVFSCRTSTADAVLAFQS